MGTDERIRSIYQGIQLENPATGYVFNAWETLAHHQALQSSPSYPVVVQSMTPAFIGPIDVLHVTFVGGLSALDKPVTQITFITLNKGASKERALELLEGIRSEGGRGATFAFGPAIEKEDIIVSIIGWDSVEEHNTTQEPPQRDELIKLMTRDSKHVKLIKVL